MIRSDDPSIVRLKLLVALLGSQALSRENDAVQVIAFIVNGLQGAERNEGRIGFTAALVVINAHYLVGHPSGIDKLAQRFDMRLAKQNIGRLPMQDDGFPPLADVRLVDETPLNHLHGLHLRIIGMHTVQRKIDVLRAITDIHRRLEHSGTGFLHTVGEACLRILQVAVVQVNGASLLQSVIRLGRPSAPHPDRVQCPFAGTFLESMYDAVARSQQHNKHEDAPCHGKAGKEGAELVAPDGSVDFLPEINHFISPPWPKGDASCRRFSSMLPITPSLMWIILSVWLATPLSWVTTTIVIPV